jgi:hypothetical protein
MSDQIAETRRLLELEYGQVRAKLDALEVNRFHVKEWSISLSSVLIALGINAGKRAVVLLCLPVAIVFALVEADYLVREQSLTARSDELEAVMESVRRNGYSAEAQTYVFGIRAVSRRGYSLKQPPPMFGTNSKAGFAYVLIILAAVVATIII